MNLTIVRITLATLLCTAGLIAPCSASATNAVKVATATPPGGLYVGYYQEDPKTNPEDPMPGAFVLNLPDQDSAFQGNMYFTYIGCQSSNIGEVKGVKNHDQLSGSWSGTIDNSAQSGPYSGQYSAATGGYQGVYSNAGGKQFKTIPGCIQYYIAPNGTWAMFPVEKNQPANFGLNLTGDALSWTLPASAAMSLVYVVDPQVAAANNGNPVKYQTVVAGKMANFKLAQAKLTHGKEYIVVVVVNNAQASRIAFASKRWVAP